MTDIFFSPSGLKGFLSERGIRLTKKFGQNFLVDRNKAIQILGLLELSDRDEVVEIGGGIGTMTVAIAERVRNIKVFEIDRGLAKILREQLADRPSAEVIEGDFLDTVRPEHFPAGVKLYSSLPYNCAMRILIRLASYGERIERLVVLLPEEIVARVKALPGSGEYGVPRVFFDTFFTLESSDVRVENRLFFPSPQGHSRVLRLFPRKVDGIPDPEEFIASVSRFFQNRRKMLNKTIPEGCGGILEEFGLSMTDRAEEAPPEFFRKVYRAVKNRPS
jgi:16S rRNA (adenine1518-N6/adenine1519-N6)-dimethyltransferase